MKKLSKMNIIIVSIVSIIIVLLIVPIFVETIKMNNQFKTIKNDINEELKEKIKEKDSSYSKYYDIKSLKYEINKIYKTNTLNEYGYEITFSVESDYESLYNTTYSLILYSIEDLLDDVINEYYDNDIKIEHYKYTLNVNGKEVYHKYEGSNYSIYDEFIKEQYKEYNIEIKNNHIVWEYNNDGIKLKSMTNYMYVILTIIGVSAIVLTTMFLVFYYEKNASANTKANVGCVGEIIKFLIIYILLGLLSGGIGFIALPLLWVLENRK